MRDPIIEDINYFQSVIAMRSLLIEDNEKAIRKGEMKPKKTAFARNRSFVHSLERLIAMYSMGKVKHELKHEYTSVLAFMLAGWDDEGVKFTKGRPAVQYDRYYLDYYCYAVWMLSLAYLLQVPRNEAKALAALIKDDCIKDGLIVFLLEAIGEKEIASSERTTYQPFRMLAKKDLYELRSEDLEKYLRHWYQNTKRLTWHSHRESIDHESCFYYGCWSFEAAAISCILRLDDTSYRGSIYYPSALYDWCKSSED